MKYAKIQKGIFIDRPNRFIAHVKVGENTETVHVKNTGRCKELLLPGCTVILEDCASNPSRKTRYDLIAVYKKYEDGHELLINMDSQAPNKVVAEWLSTKNFALIRPEFTFGNSRVDFYMEEKENHQNSGNRNCNLKNDEKIQKCLLEVKGCTLEKNGMGYFPDAPTERGVKHLHELKEAVKSGYKCFLAFVIQVPGVKKVLPNAETHPEFAAALEEAEKAGVKILYLCCDVKEDELKIIKEES